MLDPLSNSSEFTSAVPGIYVPNSVMSHMKIIIIIINMKGIESLTMMKFLS